MVTRPPHYTQGTIEAINIIRDTLGPDGFMAYCRGQVMKYVIRAPHKGNPAQDYEKALWYLRHMTGHGRE
jgi:hypothetical protein